MFGCYRRGDAADPETYAAAVAAVLSEYPPEVVRVVTDPRSGLPSRNKFLPNVAEVREACEAEMRPIRAAQAREKQLAEQLAAREEKPRAERPSYADLKAHYGDNWGLRGPNEDSAVQAVTLAQIDKANKRLFQLECERAGIDPDGGVSPDLLRTVTTA